MKSLPSVSLYVFIYIKTITAHKGNLRAERLEILLPSFFVCLVETFNARLHHRGKTCISWFFVRNRVPEMGLSYLQNIQVYYPSVKYELLIRFFLDYCYTIIFVKNILCPSKGCLVHDTNKHKIMSVLNLTIICIKPFTCNSTNFSKCLF